jgi:polar amino acid transport system permease protein
MEFVGDDPAIAVHAPAPSAPMVPLSTRLAGVAVGVGVVVLSGTAALLDAGRVSGRGSWLLTAAAVVAVALSAGGVLLGSVALRSARGSARALAEGRIRRAREVAADSRSESFWALSMQLAVVLIVAALFLISANGAEVQHTFLQWKFMRDAAPDVLSVFQTNVVIALGAEPLVLMFGLLLALLRLLPGPEARPVRWLAIAYVDIFRGLPVIIVVFLVGFGLPLTNLPILSSLSATWYAIIALTLSYSAYVAEVYRAGVESVHPSQAAAARSLGLSHVQALRHVIVPQAVRTVIAPLLSFFIGMQKDTALIGIVGTVDAFQQARIYASEQFNLSAVVLVSALFVIVTIPQTRLVDWLIARNARRRGAGA